MDLSRKTVTNYTRCRTNRGPFETWGVIIKKEKEITCPDCTLPCEHTDQHVTFRYEKFRDLRQDLLANIKS